MEKLTFFQIQVKQMKWNALLVQIHKRALNVGNFPKLFKTKRNEEHLDFLDNKFALPMERFKLIYFCIHFFFQTIWKYKNSYFLFSFFHSAKSSINFFWKEIYADIKRAFIYIYIYCANHFKNNIMGHHRKKKIGAKRRIILL